MNEAPIEGPALEVDALRKKCAAQAKTIQVLMRQVEERQDQATLPLEALRMNLQLERIVGAKTRELARERAELAEALEKLGLAQAQLVQARKLESIGQLAAGVAHEINTPIQFVSDSLGFIEESTLELAPAWRALFGLMQAVLAGKPGLDQAQEAMDLIRKSDLKFIQENMPSSFARCKEGLERVSTIVQSMKAFAHPDSGIPEPADLNKMVKATLEIARNEYKYVATLETDLQPLPPVTCVAGELNQVVLNLVVNAAQAVA